MLVHGAFHGAWCWDPLRPELERLGIAHDTVDLPFTSTEDDVATVREAIDRGGEGVTVLGHSFGGAVISAAAAEDGKHYSATTSLIFLTAFMTAPEYGGAVITNAATGNPNVKALVYVDAFAPDPVGAKTHLSSGDVEQR